MMLKVKTFHVKIYILCLVMGSRYGTWRNNGGIMEVN